MAAVSREQETLARALHLETRRHFFVDCGVGLGAAALGSLLAGDRRVFATEDSPSRGKSSSRGESAAARERDPLAPRPGHFPARAKSVIYLFMAGGPSQLELFDYKPHLQKYSGQPIPESFIAGRRFAFMDSFTKEHPKLLGHGSIVRPARLVGCLGFGAVASHGQRR